jgi:hypothetical protein
MKTYIRFSIALSLVFLPRVLNAQLQFRDTVDFDGPMSPGTAVYLDPTDTVNPWIIGDPQKSVFNHAFSEPFCIFTDTLVSVLPGDTSSFVVKFRYSSYSTFGIQFNTRLSFASRDTGYLQYSFDSLTWYHPVGDTAETDPCGSATVQYMLYPFSVSNSTDTVAAMDYMNFNCIPDLPYDTVYFRFTFVADTVQMLREGWMIDDIVF